ncbi:uncharacterized [Tachysurus ichikawai]
MVVRAEIKASRALLLLFPHKESTRPCGSICPSRPSLRYSNNSAPLPPAAPSPSGTAPAGKLTGTAAFLCPFPHQNPHSLAPSAASAGPEQAAASARP